MQQKTDKDTAQREHALQELEKVHKKYGEYLKQLHDLSTLQGPEPEPQYAEPSPENPLTNNRFTIYL